MGEKFEPRRVQAEYLRAPGFTRDVFVALVRNASATLARANAFLKRYGLDPIEREEVGLRPSKQ